MRTTRLVAGSVTAGLIGLTPIAIAAPSHAADSWTTQTVAAPDTTKLVYGDDFSVDVDLSSSDGYSPAGADGTVTLMAREAGSAAWVPVATGETTYASFYDVEPTATTTYKVVYSGYTDPEQDQFADNYAPSESASFTVEVARRITYPSSGFVIKGKVTPRYAKKKIVIKVSRKQNKGYRSFKTIRTGSRGKYKVTLPRRGGTWYWSFAIRGDDKYLANAFVWKTFVG